ncbi:PucR family transcriptional regulator [Actinomadura rugatobispora]|uniref:PucR family transcriptional regulator n=1 Tax=Actinomadura rugatobispora TaxID=1994 RepID=A0ABW1ACD6_9ACTN|nr:PucR family transcriptional regulator [Actinomadura rugatobispora]
MPQVTTVRRAPAGRDRTPLPGLTSEVARLRPELPSLAEEIGAEIRHSVAEFDHPCRGRDQGDLRSVVEQALERFVDRAADPPAPRDHEIKVFRDLGRGEYRAGRDLAALQAAYRVAARVGWRRIAEVGRRAGWPAERMSLLAEMVFAYVEEIAEYSVQGYAQARQSTTDRLKSLRRRLFELVLSEDQATSGEALADLAREADWRLPATVAGVAIADWDAGAGRLAPAIGPDVLMDLERPDPRLLVPDPDAPGRQDMLARALRDTPFAIGPSVSLAEAALSVRLAGQALSLVRRGVIRCDHYVRCSDELSTLLLSHNEDVIRLMTARRYGPLAALKPQQRDRLDETLLAWLASGGRAPEIAARLHVHAQTVRYRMRRLQELFGDEMNDPDWKFEMEIVLRTKLLLKDE